MVSTFCTIGVDLGGQSVKLAVVDGGGAIRVRKQAVVDAAWDLGRFIELIRGEVASLGARGEGRGKKDAGTRERGEIGAIGVVMPGYMDRERSRLLFAANLPLLGGTSFLADLRAALPLPVVFDADSNAAALAESRFGAGRGVGRLMVVSVGTGIGGGVIIDGEVLRIREHIAGSLGHVIVYAKGPRCKCGARGCVEALAAGPALERRAGELAGGGGGIAGRGDAETRGRGEEEAVGPPRRVNSGRLSGLQAERGRLTCVEIGEALRQGDAAARQAVSECGWWLGAGVASWCAIYAPEVVLIAGGVAMLGEPLLDAVRAGMLEVGQPNLVRDVRVEAAALGADAGAIGAAAMARLELRS